MTARQPDLSFIRKQRDEIDQLMGWNKRMDTVKIRAVLWGGIGIAIVGGALFLAQVPPKVIGPVVVIGAVLAFAPFFVRAEKLDKETAGLRDGMDRLAGVIQPGPVPGHVFALFVVGQPGDDARWMSEAAAEFRERVEQPPGAEWVRLNGFMQLNAVTDASGAMRRMRVPDLRGTAAPVWLMILPVTREMLGADVLPIRVAFEATEPGKLATIAAHVATEHLGVREVEYGEDDHAPANRDAMPVAAAVLPVSHWAAG